MFVLICFCEKARIHLARREMREPLQHQIAARQAMPHAAATEAIQ
jgi:hypothetical protein